MKQQFALVLTLLVVLGVASGCGNAEKPTTPSTSSPAKVNGQPTTTPSGLQYWEIVVGTGPAAVAGNVVKVHYTGWLTTGEKFDSSRDRGVPFTFPLGAGQVIKGWDEGLLGMQVGDKRKLTIPPDLAYGAEAKGPIPANSTLVFDVELVGLKRG